MLYQARGLCVLGEETPIQTTEASTAFIRKSPESGRLCSACYSDSEMGPETSSFHVASLLFQCHFVFFKVASAHGHLRLPVVVLRASGVHILVQLQSCSFPTIDRVLDFLFLS